MVLILKSGPINSWLEEIKRPINYLHALIGRALSRKPLWSGAGEFNVVVDDDDKTKLGKVSELSEVVLTQLLHKDSLIRMDVKE